MAKYQIIKEDIYVDLEGKQTTLRKSITDHMQPDDNQKKEAAAGYFSEMLRYYYGEPLEVVTRNIIEI